MSAYVVRDYTPDDWDMVSAWWDEHTNERTFAPNILPPVGIVVMHEDEPVCACWCHLSAGVGVAFLDMPVAKPGVRAFIIREAFSHALAMIEKIARGHNYGFLMAFTLPTIARYLERNEGFQRDGERVQLVKLLT